MPFDSDRDKGLEDLRFQIKGFGMIIIAIVIGVFAVLSVIGLLQKTKIDKDLLENAYEGNGTSVKYHQFMIYQSLIKPVMDKLLSFAGLVLLSPVFLIIAVLIYIDDPGPILFAQKRVGKNKTFFKLHKFRSMKMSTPHDMPTHMLANPEQYITKVGKFLRKSSLDELPQIWDIFIGNMSVIGPRPALWNQKDLVEERDKYGANDIKPGLTGWAQINGRDELEIDVKAKLDGDYTEILFQSGKGFWMDCKCFVGTVFSVVASKGVVEGGTGAIEKEEKQNS